MKRILSLAAIFALLLIIPGCATRERVGGFTPDSIFGDGGDEGDARISNDELELVFLAETAEVILYELDNGVRTGNMWYSTPPGIVEDPRTTAIERFLSQSLFAIEFESRTGSDQRFDAYRFSVRNGTYEHEIIDNEVLELRFTVGDVPKTFIVPRAIDAERFNYFIGKMERFNQREVQNEFRADEIGGVDVFMLRPDVPDFRLEIVQENLRNAGYTYEDWVSDMARFNIETEIQTAAFNFIMRFELVRNNMLVTVPLREITYVNDFMPTQLTIMPYFGAASAEDDGYLFVPDGSGSLLYFDTARHTQGRFHSNIYGRDEAIVPPHILHDNRSAFPVFGVYRNGATFAAIIEEGSAYASVRAEVAGMLAPYSRVHPLFRLLHGTPLDVQGRTNDSMVMHEWDLPDEDIVIRYVITRGDGYVGMAHAYREFLQERYPQLRERVNKPVTAMVEVLGAALTPQHILGFPVDRPFPLTSYAQAADMMETMHSNGWRNVHIKMRGAHNDSIDHIVPTSLDIISQLGGRRGFNNMVNAANERDYTFYLEGDFMFMRGTKMFDGFSRIRDAARQSNREVVEHAGFSAVYFGQLGTAAIMADPIILARPEFTIRTARNFVNEANRHGVNNIAFRSMASALAGDFNEDRHVTREASMDMRADLLEELKENETRIWLNYGFSYGVPYADIITGMPLTDQDFGITDTAVPFYQIALHGLVPFAGRPINLAEDFSNHHLKSIESGASLFFNFMNVPTADLLVTRYRRYFANEFGRWFETANRLYNDHAQNLGHLYNQLIVDHQILNAPQGGVTVTIYEDGTHVFVNTTMSDFSIGNFVIEPRSYRVFNSFDGEIVATTVESTPAPEPEQTRTVEVGDNLQFGGYDWLVLNVANDLALIITQDIIALQHYHDQPTDVTWETSDIRRYLNEEFYYSFSDEERERIIETYLINHENPWYETPGGNDTADNIFLLNLQEAVKYFGDSGMLQNRPDVTLSDVGRTGYYNDYADSEWLETDPLIWWIFDSYNDNRRARYDDSYEWWWLRSPGWESTSAANVYPEGFIFVSGGFVDVSWPYGGVRPALWLNYGQLSSTH
ncbi:MAG: DUF5696 domain-containing protein [Defluviitaleaceae bacterium]|nr:DUF5696 domain-containing protein [Defluviitaleaceae bacterium]